MSQAHQGPDYTQHPELAVVALMSMLARFPFTRCGRMAESILAHLEFVAAEPRLPKAYRDAAFFLIPDWQWLLAGSPQAAASQSEGAAKLH